MDSIPPSVQTALSTRPYKACNSRRDLSTALRAFSTAWTALEQAPVLSAACRRLGERAAGVMLGVYGKLKELDDAERAKNEGKVVLERYEYRREPSEDGTAQNGQSGTTKLKIQSAMLDVQMFATDFIALSTTSRLSLLVDDLPNQQGRFRSLASTLSTCISLYSLSSLSISIWPDEDAEDLVRDLSALPRLFQLSIGLRGPTYDAFLREQAVSPTLVQETPARRRAAFLAWCVERNPLLKAKDGSASPSPIRRKSPKVSWPPAEGALVGLGLPPSLSESLGSPPRRAVSQPPLSDPLPSSSPSSQSLAEQSAVLLSAESPTRAIAAAVSPSLETPSFQPDAAYEADAAPSLPASPTLRPAPVDATKPQAPITTISPRVDKLAEAVSVALPPSPLPSSPADAVSQPPVHDFLLVQTSEATEATEPSSPPPTVDEVVPAAPLASLAVEAKPDESDKAELALARRESSASSIAMTPTSSHGSKLFEPTLSPFAGIKGETTEERQAVVEIATGTFKEVELKEVGEVEVEEVRVVEVEAEVEPLPTVVSSGGIEPKSEEEVAEEIAPVVVQEVDSVQFSEEDAAIPAENEVAAVVEQAKDDVKTSTVPSILLTAEPEAFAIDSSPLGVEEPAVETTSPPIVESATPSPPTTETAPLPSTVLPPVLPTTPNPPFRVLSLDGGGLVGPIPQLFLLKQHLSSLPSSPLPSQHFALIVGTSSSALLAILLGTLEMSIDEALSTYERIAAKAFPLELPRVEGVVRKPKKSRWWHFGRSSPPVTQPAGPSDAVRREMALEEALRTYLPSATAAFASRGSCRTAVLAFEKRGSTTQERWLVDDETLSIVEVVKTSLAASSFFPSSSSYSRAPASLNPASSTLVLAKASLSTPSQPTHLLSIGTGYASLSLDAAVSKRITPARFSAFRDVKQLAASNAAAAASLLEKVRAQEGVEVERLDVDCGRCGIVEREEWDTKESIRGAVSAPRRRIVETESAQAFPASISFARPSLSSSSTLSPPQTVKKRASRLSFFKSNDKDEHTGHDPILSRRASSFVPAPTSTVAPLSPSLSLCEENATLSPPAMRGLRSSISLHDLGRGEGKGLYGLKEEAGSTSSLSG